jgi:hypothetical protein
MNSGTRVQTPRDGAGVTVGKPSSAPGGEVVTVKLDEAHRTPGGKADYRVSELRTI